MMTATEQTLLYPRLRRYPFDRICERIVRELERRNWEVPGIKVEFHSFVSDGQEYRYVYRIEGDGWRLTFLRIQYGNWHISRLYNVSDIHIPRMELNVYPDDSGPDLYVYVGNNWEADKNRFFNSVKVNSKFLGEPRWYVQYSGYYNNRMKPSRDLGRQYGPRPWEHRFYFNFTVYLKFARWLWWHVLWKIRRYPLADG